MREEGAVDKAHHLGRLRRSALLLCPLLDSIGELRTQIGDFAGLLLELGRGRRLTQLGQLGTHQELCCQYVG